MQQSCANESCSGVPFRKIGGVYYCSGCVTYHKHHQVFPVRKNCVGCGRLLQQRTADKSDYCKKCSQGLPCQAIVGGEACPGRRGKATGIYCHTHNRDSVGGVPFRTVVHRGGKNGCFRHGNPTPCYLCSRDRELVREYGITYEQFEEMRKGQNGLCAFPRCTTDLGKKSLFVDHDHSTGRVRSLLCSRHNFLLGHAQDSVEELQFAIEYLVTHSEEFGQDADVVYRFSQVKGITSVEKGGE